MNTRGGMVSDRSNAGPHATRSPARPTPTDTASTDALIGARKRNPFVNLDSPRTITVCACDRLPLTHSGDPTTTRITVRWTPGDSGLDVAALLVGGAVSPTEHVAMEAQANPEPYEDPLIDEAQQRRNCRVRSADHFSRHAEH